MNDESVTTPPVAAVELRKTLVGGVRAADAYDAIAAHQEALVAAEAEIARLRTLVVTHAAEVEAARAGAGQLRVVQELLKRAEDEARQMTEDAERRASNVRRAAEAQVKTAAAEVQALLEVKGRLRGQLDQVLNALEAAPAGFRLCPRESEDSDASWKAPAPRVSTVELTIGPIADLGSLAELEHDVGTLEGVHDVYVRELSDSRALIEVSTEAGTPLADSLARGLRRPFVLHEARADRVVVSLLPADDRLPEMEASL